MSRFPLRSEWNTIWWPSGDQSGLKSPAGSVVNCRGSPPTTGTTYRSGFPFLSESNTSQRPSAETSTSSMVSFPDVIRVAPRMETGPREGTGMDQILEYEISREYAIRPPFRLTFKPCASAPVVRRWGLPSGAPPPLMRCRYTSRVPSRSDIQ
jgi:hypothetical protein